MLQDIINEMLKLKDHTEISDVVDDMIEILGYKEINMDQCEEKIAEFKRKYPLEMKIILKKEELVEKNNNYQPSYKEILINCLISIAVIKILTKQDKMYTNNEINNYNFLYEVLKAEARACMNLISS